MGGSGGKLREEKMGNELRNQFNFGYIWLRYMLDSKVDISSKQLNIKIKTLGLRLGLKI